MAQPLPWSHSALQGFDTCGRQYEEVKVLRHFQDQKNEASLWGDDFHKEAEHFIGYYAQWGVADKLSPRMQPYAGYLAQFIGRPGKTSVEQKYGLDRRLQPCDFFAETIWSRAVIDVLTIHGSVAWVDDHKTGKNRKKDMQQLIIFALHVFYHHPEVDTVHTAFHWVQYGFDESAKDRETFTRAQIPELWATLMPKLQRYAEAFHRGIFQPKPSGLCKKHCPVNTCEYWGKGRR